MLLTLTALGLLMMLLPRRELAAPTAAGGGELHPRADRSPRAPVARPATPQEGHGVVDLILHGCEGEVALVASEGVGQRLAWRAGAPIEVTAPIVDGIASIERLAAVSYSIEVGGRALGWVQPDPSGGGRFVGSCTDDCALQVDVVTDGCAAAALVELRAEAGEQLRSELVPLEEGGATVLWRDLACGTAGVVTAEADGCAPLREEVTVSSVLDELRLVLPAAGLFRVRAIDLQEGFALAGAAVSWTRHGGDARFEAGPWHGQEHVIEGQAPPETSLRIGAPGYVPLEFRPPVGQEPEEVMDIGLEALSGLAVRCTLDDEPCSPDRVDLFGAWYVAQGPVEQDACEPAAEPGMWDCLAAPATTEENHPYVDGWVDGAWRGRVAYRLPRQEPLDLTLEDEPDAGTILCSRVIPAQRERCELWVPRQAGGAEALLYEPGTERSVDAEPGAIAILACPDGFGSLRIGVSGCPSVELQPWGAVCVAHVPALTCLLLDSVLPISAARIEGCNDRVLPGAHGVSCAKGATDGVQQWQDCGEVEVTVGETSEVACW